MIKTGTRQRWLVGSRVGCAQRTPDGAAIQSQCRCESRLVSVCVLQTKDHKYYHANIVHTAGTWSLVLVMSHDSGCRGGGAPSASGCKMLTKATSWLGTSKK